MIKTSIGEIEDDCEVVVIEHPMAGQNPGLATLPKHVHDGREVICKRSVNELPIGPIVGHAASYKYVRADRVDAHGRPIFVEAK
jgi:hypothetical protein